MICFTWWGLTQYAARAIEAFNRASNEPVCVVATRPKSSPISGMDKVLTCPLIWVDENDMDVKGKLPEVPRVLFVSNWNLPCWQGIMNATRSAGGKIVAMSDADYQLSAKAILRAIRFRLKLKRKFDAFFVVGKSGEKLMQMYGVEKSRIFKGLYGADAALFHNGESLADRPKRILYVGQFIHRKNILRLVDAFVAFRSKHPDWELELCGHGVLHNQIPDIPGLIVHDFVQPEQLAAIYRNARAFILPSIEEHWGVVVHEAALSGCFLLLSETVGAAADFASKENSILFSPYDKNEILKSLEVLSQLSDEKLQQAENDSLAKASRFGLSRFVAAVKEIVSS